MNNIDSAIRDCQQAVGVDPTFWRAQVRLARAFALKGNFENAKEILLRSLKLFSSSYKNNNHQDGDDDDNGDEGIDVEKKETERMKTKEQEEREEVVQNIKSQLKATEQLEKSKLEYEAGNYFASLNSLNHDSFKDSVFIDDLSVRVFKSKLQLLLLGGGSGTSSNQNQQQQQYALQLGISFNNNNCEFIATFFIQIVFSVWTWFSESTTRQ